MKTIEEIRWLVDYYNARVKWEFPQEIQNYKTLIAEIDRLKRMLGETDSEEARIHIEALLRGIVIWANDEDGVHDECFDAFQSAAYFMGKPELVKTGT
jgi:hypothetical protein